MKQLKLYLLLLGLVGLTQSCAPPFIIKAPVTRPCEINFKEYNFVCVDPCIGPFGNNAPGKRIDSTLISYLSDSCNFKVITPPEFQDSLQKIGMKISDVMKTENKSKLAKLGKIALISSKVLTYEYDRGYILYGRRFFSPFSVATVKVFFKLTDLTSGKILISKYFTTNAFDFDKSLSYEENKRIQLHTACLDVVKNFSKFIHPFTEPIDIEFILDSDFPILQESINLIGKGSWNEGIMKLESAVPLAKDKDLQAIVYYDLALAYQYTYSFDKAREAFTRACALSKEEKYFEAADACKEMEDDFRNALKVSSEEKEE